MDLIFTISAAGLATVGFALCAWALLWDRSRGRRRCPRCWYDMSGSTGLRCPGECGRAARSERALRRTRRRWPWAVVAALLFLSALGCWRWPLVRDHGWARAAPTTALVLVPYDAPGWVGWCLDGGDAPWPTPLTVELRRRFDDGDIAGWQTSVLFTRLQWRLGWSGAAAGEARAATKARDALEATLIDGARADRTLAEAVRLVAERSGVPVRVDWESLAEAGVGPEDTFECGGPASAAELLDEMSINRLDDGWRNPGPLIWTLDGGSVLITAWDRAPVHAAIYDVEDIAPLEYWPLRVGQWIPSADDDSDRLYPDAGSVRKLAEVLAALLVERRGTLPTGAASPTMEAGETLGRLAIRATALDHLIVRDLLGALRDTRPLAGRPRALRRLERAARMAQAPVRLDAGISTLNELLQSIEIQTGVPIRLDHGDLERWGVTSPESLTVRVPEAVVTAAAALHLAGRTLASALSPRLGYCPFVWIPDADGIRLTGIHSESRWYVTLVHDASDLLDRDSEWWPFFNVGGVPDPRTYDEVVDTLIDALINTVDPDSWTLLGGWGADIKHTAGKLIVRASPVAHLEIERVLNEIRAIHARGRP